MIKCPNCNHAFEIKKEVITTFDSYDQWEEYVTKNMSKADRFAIGSKTSIQSGDRVLAEWNGFDYGFVSEGRRNKLKRLTYY